MAVKYIREKEMMNTRTRYNEMGNIHPKKNLQKKKNWIEIGHGRKKAQITSIRNENMIKILQILKNNKFYNNIMKTQLKI